MKIGKSDLIEIDSIDQSEGINDSMTHSFVHRFLSEDKIIGSSSKDDY